ncbi:unnamed protein product [Symbiodinium sp. CCMP2592]|nr:unnamed protein product [Symbiodinium sp. CCMP2592]
MAVFATVDCLHLVWSKNREITSRLEEGGRLVRAVDGSTFVKASEEHCLENRHLLEAYMVRQRGARSLDVPDVESLKAQLISLHTLYAMNRAKTSKRPKALLEATVEIVQANAHLDAKAFKRLLSYARQRFMKPHLPKELYGKGGKKTRWDVTDADEAAGIEDAYEEDMEDAEEEEAEYDPTLDVDPMPEPVLDVARIPEPVLDVARIPEPVLDVGRIPEPVLDAVIPPPEAPEPRSDPPLQKKGVFHMNSSTSVASDATTLILGQSPATPKPKLLHVPSSSALTPSPPSLPDASRVVFKEVLYVAESPRKMVKAEPHDEALKPTLSEPEPMDKETAMRELALLEAYRKEQLARAAEAPQSEEEEGEITPTEADAEESQLGEAPEPEPMDEKAPEPEPMDKKAAMRELALLQVQLQLRSGALADGPAPASKPVLDTDDTQAIRREEQLDARKKRKEIAAAKKAAAKDKEAQELADAEVCQAPGQAESVEQPAKKRRTAAKSSSKKPRVQEDPKTNGDAVSGDASVPEAATGEDEAEKEPKAGKGSKKGSGRGKGRGKGRGRGTGNKGRGKGRGAGSGKAKAKKTKKGKGKGKGAEASEAAPERRVSKKTTPERKDEDPKKRKPEKIELRKLVVATNGILNHFVLMVYWTRPGVGIKQMSDGKQVQYFGSKGATTSKLLHAAIECVKYMDKDPEDIKGINQFIYKIKQQLKKAIS